MKTQFIEINYWELIKNIAISSWEWFWAISKMLFDLFIIFLKSGWKFIIAIILIVAVLKIIEKFVYKRKI
ncbi:MAG: hypothetical protein Q7R92_04160 [bacterium]|nr:hypothetical protein [bacterium]